MFYSANLNLNPDVQSYMIYEVSHDIWLPSVVLDVCLRPHQQIHKTKQQKCSYSTKQFCTFGDFPNVYNWGNIVSFYISLSRRIVIQRDSEL